MKVRTTQRTTQLVKANMVQIRTRHVNNGLQGSRLLVLWRLQVVFM